MADVDINLAFHRKYRPSTLAQYVGNDKLKLTALSAIAKQVKPQVILLEGASGCGKTTFARLLAKEYLCEDRNNTTGACNSCTTCESLDEYIHTGDTSMLSTVREIDIADQSGKKDIDVVLDEMQIPSYGDEWKVFIFDECHMATPQAQNRMLKVAEEPPRNVLMIFCTTDPEMMIETLVNRCQLRLHVKKPTVSDLSGLLKYVCKAEQVDYDIKGLNFIANRSELTIRTSLTSLEQVISEQGNAKYDFVILVFEEVSDKIIAEFYRKLLPTASGKRDIMGYVTLLHKIKSQTELKSFVSSLIDFTRRGIYIINQITLEGVSDGELLVYRNIFSQFTIEQMANLMTKLSDLRGKDIETRLLLLGYTGILNNFELTNDIQLPTENDSTVEKPSSELEKEKGQAVKNREIAEELKLVEGQAYAKSLNMTANIDDIQSQFGAVEIVSKK